jgi:hypothetical protein
VCSGCQDPVCDRKEVDGEWGFINCLRANCGDRGADDQDIHTQSAAVLSSGSGARNDNEEASDLEDDEQDVQGDNNTTSDKSPLSWLMSLVL